ncbi:MAG: ECF transporter S component [Tepidibacter sp.]|uniref:CD3073 family putative ECF transporter S component n=1 Tax=Tepidibacter sp. TaxID=2529387 RepID=UPI0025D30939|nr:CD3073 family putative ECF transporter S component [Tepidibacter sp.]MCT4509623.1 ECF transporter S component [Tepidibacter sp.]
MSKTRNLTFVAMGIVINIVFGTVVSMIKIPLLFLDTIGTVFIAAILGPWYGAVAGGLTNIIQGIITNPKTMPFALVNIVIGLIVGCICKKREFNFQTAFITGMILAVVAPLIGTPIAIYLFGGITGDGNDLIFTWLLTSGKTIFSAAFIPRITGNILDKIATCIFVSFLLKRLPREYIRKQGNI